MLALPEERRGDLIAKTILASDSGCRGTYHELRIFVSEPVLVFRDSVRQDQYERYYVARCNDEFVVEPAVPDTYVIGHRWWTLREIEESPDDFTPRRLAEYLPQFLGGDYPEVPFDCGV